MQLTLRRLVRNRMLVLGITGVAFVLLVLGSVLLYGAPRRLSGMLALYVGVLFAFLGVAEVTDATGQRRELRRRLWAADGRCASCGYDLRASRDYCPECGRAYGCRRGQGPRLILERTPLPPFRWRLSPAADEPAERHQTEAKGPP